MLGKVFAVAVIAALLTSSQSYAQSGVQPVQPRALPPASVLALQSLANHANAAAHIQTPASEQTATRATFAVGGSWQAVAAAPVQGLCNPLLLTDGTVMIASCDTPDWYRLTPDKFGNYAAGTWSRLASLPIVEGKPYAPQYHASAVLPDGRVIVMGGEYDGGDKEVWTHQGAIYDPLANSWTAVPAPRGSGWKRIGDAQSVVLANGTFMLASCCANPDVDALLDPTTLSWTGTGAPNAGAGFQDEQGYELLPNNRVLTIDIWTNSATQGNATNAERYDPRSGVWTGAGRTPVSLVDPYVCGNFEIGPAVLRGDGTVVAFGGNTGCAAPTADPTAIYDSARNRWSAGPNLPAVCGTQGNLSCDLADAPAALLPDGNILFAASDGFGDSPTHFFEFTASNTVQQVSDPLDYASISAAFYYNFVELPNGQILSTDFSNIAEVYTPAGNPVSGWAPVVAKVATSLARGTSYVLAGKGLNGVSQGAYYGDDVQTASNYPIVRITNVANGHVVYARTFNQSTMSVSPNVSGSTYFTVPERAESGASQLAVIANGIASAPVSVTIE